MAIATLRQLLDNAAENGYAIPAFNVSNLEIVQAVMMAARKTDSPVILQASRSARAYAGDAFIRHIVEAAAEEYPEIPICLHLDHGDKPSTCVSAIANGFTSVMMDGSLEADGKTVASYDYNVNVTREVVNIAHAAGVSVEGEIGVLGSLETGSGEKEDGHGFEGTLSTDQLLTDPDQAADFVERTGVDALAVACGTSHGAYKFTREPDGEILSMDTISHIHKRLPNTHIVMHGSSSVPEALQELVNAYGGNIRKTWGVPVEEIKKGIAMGVRKVNIDTDLRLAFTGAIRKFLAESPEKFDPRGILTAARAQMTDECQSRFEDFGSAGHGSTIRVRRLADVAKSYAVKK